MNKNKSKYFNTALFMNEALLSLLEKKDFEYITVKELCNKAGVNRSTFYLHYETMNDLLNETINMIEKKFYSSFNKDLKIDDLIKKDDKKDLILVTSEYLKPYLHFVFENRKVFKLALKRATLFNSENAFSKMNKEYFIPIMNHFNINEKIQSFVLMYYCSGLVSIISKWLDNNCQESVDEIIDIMKYCLRLDEILKTYND
ncbi:MAG TPA: TetR/AcrR family transcriptional regulator [Firmicutes bacterium]|nr:TetR/AcrR family transcriptional regulator [Bacillota bacterium]